MEMPVYPGIFWLIGGGSQTEERKADLFQLRGEGSKGASSPPSHREEIDPVKSGQEREEEPFQREPLSRSAE